MATIRDVAKEARVSIATVSHVINETRYVSQELAVRVQTAMERLNYFPNGIARSLKTQKTHTIGLIISDISNPFFSTLVRGVEDAAAENGYSVIISDTDEDLVKEKLYIRVLIQRRIDGLIIAPTGKEDQDLRLLSERGIPLVFVDRKLDGVEADSVLSKNIEGAYQATKYLIKNGHRRIGIILGLKDVSTSEERFIGYKKALKEFAIAEDRELIAQGNFKIEGGMKACKQLFSLQNPPSAVFSLNNLTTIGVLRTLRELGLRYPKDIEVVGFDDSEWVDMLDFSLPTVVQHPYEMGYQATQLLFARIKGEGVQGQYEQLRLSTTLKVSGKFIGEP